MIDPLGSLVAWGVSWLMEHVRPLQEALDWLAGNPDEVAAHAATWRHVSAAADGAHQQYAEAVRAQTAAWSGGSGDAYRAHANQQLDAMGGIARASEAISYAVEGAGLLVGLVRGIVRDPNAPARPSWWSTAAMPTTSRSGGCGPRRISRRHIRTHLSHGSQVTRSAAEPEAGSAQ